MIAAELLHGAVLIANGLKPQRREIERRGPTFGPPVQHRDVVLFQLKPGSLHEQLTRFGVREGKVIGAQLGQRSAGA